MNRINPTNNNDPTFTFKPEVLEALREFRHLKPWRGTVDERRIKFQSLHAALCGIYDCNWSLDLDHIEAVETEHGNAGLKYENDSARIVLVGKLSVVSYLYCFALSIFARDRRQANAWAIALYKRIFRLSAARMNFRDQNGETFVLQPSVGQN